MKQKIIHIVSADADPALLRSVAALHQAERQLGADSRLWTTRIVGGASHQLHLPVAGQDWRRKLATGHAPAWFRRLWGTVPAAPAALPALETATGLAERVKAARPDLVHLHALRGELASAEELAGLPGRLFWSVYDKSLMSMALMHCPIWQKRDFQPIAATVSLADGMRSSPLFQGRSSEIVLPSVDPVHFHPDPERRACCRAKSGISGTTFVVMCDGARLTPFAAEVLAALNDELSGDLLVLTLGAPCCPLTCRNRRAADGGGFDRALADLYRAADLWIEWEGDPEYFPSALLEAEACGTPALLPGGAMARCLISPEWNGLLVKRQEIAGWVQSILAIREDQEGYGAAACEQIFTSFSPLNAARRMLSL